MKIVFIAVLSTSLLAPATLVAGTGGNHSSPTWILAAADPCFGLSAQEIVGPNFEALQVLPPGNRILTQQNVVVVIDRRTGCQVVARERPDITSRPPPGSSPVVTQIRQADQPPTNRTFDPEVEIRNLSRLSGDAFESSRASLLLQISGQLARERDRIRKQAAAQSGLEDAQRSLQRNIELDQQSGFRARFSQASAQTIAAHDRLNQATVGFQSLFESLLAADIEIGRLKGAQDALLLMDRSRSYPR